MRAIHHFQAAGKYICVVASQAQHLRNRLNETAWYGNRLLKIEFKFYLVHHMNVNENNSEA